MLFFKNKPLELVDSIDFSETQNQSQQQQINKGVGKIVRSFVDIMKEIKRSNLSEDLNIDCNLQEIKDILDIENSNELEQNENSEQNFFNKEPNFNNSSQKSSKNVSQKHQDVYKYLIQSQQQIIFKLLTNNQSNQQQQQSSSINQTQTNQVFNNYQHILNNFTNQIKIQSNMQFNSNLTSDLQGTQISINQHNQIDQINNVEGDTFKESINQYQNQEDQLLGKNTFTSHSNKNEIPNDSKSNNSEPTQKVIHRKRIKKQNICGHPEKEHYAKGMCTNCYHRNGRSKEPWKCSHKKLYAKGYCQNCYINRYNQDRRANPDAPVRQKSNKTNSSSKAQQKRQKSVNKKLNNLLKQQQSSSSQIQMNGREQQQQDNQSHMNLNQFGEIDFKITEDNNQNNNTNISNNNNNEDYININEFQNFNNNSNIQDLRQSQIYSNDTIQGRNGIKERERPSYSSYSDNYVNKSYETFDTSNLNDFNLIQQNNKQHTNNGGINQSQNQIFEQSQNKKQINNIDLLDQIKNSSNNQFAIEGFTNHLNNQKNHIRNQQYQLNNNNSNVFNFDNGAQDFPQQQQQPQLQQQQLNNQHYQFYDDVQNQNNYVTNLNQKNSFNENNNNIYLNINNYEDFNRIQNQQQQQINNNNNHNDFQLNNQDNPNNIAHQLNLDFDELQQIQLQSNWSNQFNQQQQNFK